MWFRGSWSFREYDSALPSVAALEIFAERIVTYMAEHITPSKHMNIPSQTVYLAVFVIGILAILLVWFFGFFYAQTARPVALAWASLTLPKDLHDAQFLTKNMRNEQSTYGFSYLPDDAGFLLGIERVGDSILRATLMPDGTYLLSRNGEVLISRTEPLALPTLSPNGKIIAFTESADGTQLDPGTRQAGTRSFLELRNLRSVLYYPASGKTVTIGAGAAPLFLDDTHIIRFSPGGIIMTDLTTGNETVLLQQSLASLNGPVLQSSDRTLVTMTDRVAGKTYVLRVSPSSAETVAEFDVAIVPAALTESALYELRNTTSGVDLWRHALDGSSEKKVTSFPDTFRVSAIAVQK